MPTASAVVADMIDTAVGRTRITFRNLELWSNREARFGIREHRELPGRYYLRLMVEDSPGVMAQITGAIGEHGISIASVIQHEPSPDGDANVVPLVIMTHTATESAAADALRKIDKLDCVKTSSVRMRVLD